MQRLLLKSLLAWKKADIHKPLLLRGARQVGKTYLVKEFGSYFTNFININFELEPEYKKCFQTLKPQEILQAISLESGQLITPKESLLFLDEIQECPAAITALRYFKELIPELHVIGAGSLLEFALEQDDFSMPVGRIEFMYLKPLSYEEFLVANGYDLLVSLIKTKISLNSAPLESVHDKLIKLIKQYIVIGGMPEAQQDFLTNNSLDSVSRLQTALLSTYRNDFGKYASADIHHYLQAVFTNSALLVGKTVKYVDIDRDLRSRGLKNAITLLEKAGVITSIFASLATSLPLNSNLNKKKFKLLYLDTGLACRASKVDILTLLRDEINFNNTGHIIEQFVGQELLAYMPFYQEPELYFWAKDNPGSQAEIDYVIEYKGTIIPIEVKAGKTGRLKSLRIFMEQRDLRLGVKVSQQPLSLSNGILSIPFYMLSQLPRILDEALLLIG